jgi:hypothetical protein
MSAAWYADDAEAAGVDAVALLADPTRAVRVLGGASFAPAARHAVIQRFGGVGALIVVACEEVALRDAARVEEHAGEEDSIEEDSVEEDGVSGVAEVGGTVQAHLVRLLDDFGQLGPAELDGLLEEVEAQDGSRRGDEACARRWLNVTYAIAARDRTPEAHHAYVEALDRVLATKRSLVAS